MSQASIKLESDDHLELLIRGGYEFGLGIFVTGVHADSVAEKLGLKVRPGLSSLIKHPHSFCIDSSSTGLLMKSGKSKIYRFTDLQIYRFTDSL